jgi:hypothetical protein
MVIHKKTFWWNWDLEKKLENLCFLKNLIDTTFRYSFSGVNKTNLKYNKLKHILKNMNKFYMKLVMGPDLSIE